MQSILKKYPFLILLFFSCSNKPKIIPFQYDRYLFVQGAINDTINGNFLFDTGAFGLFIDSCFNSRQSLQYAYFDYQNTDNNSFKRKLTFSTANVSAEPALISPFKAKETFGRKCDGIIGWDIFIGRKILINYGAKIISVYSKEDKLNLSEFVEVPFQLKDNRILVNLIISINDSVSISGPFVFDTGFGGTLYLTGACTRKYALSKLNPKFDFAIKWGNSKSIQSTGFVSKAKGLQLSSFKFNGLYLECSNDQEGILAEGDYLGLLGNRVLENFDIALDFANNKLYLKRHEKQSKFDFTTNGFGLVDRTDIKAGFVVTTIFENSEADNAGLKTGDILTSVNDLPVSSYPDSLLNYIKINQEHKKCTFRRGDSMFILKVQSKVWN